MQQQIWNPLWSEESEEISQGRMVVRKNTNKLPMCIDVKNAAHFPPKVEKGMWPENYSLSDHARLTAASSPLRMPYSQPIF